MVYPSDSLFPGGPTVWTEASDVIGAWIGEGAPTDENLVLTWLGKAERMVRSTIEGIQARIDGGLEPDLYENARDVVIEMVTEKFRNPEGVRQRQEGTGPFTGSVTYGGDKPGALFMTSDQIKLLSVPATTGQRAFSVDMIPSWR